MKNLSAAIILFTMVFSLSAQEKTWPFLDNKAMGSYDFIKQNPESDGRGTLIFILDNSVDPLIPGLTKTSEGKTKVIDMQDFTGQSVLKLTEAKIDTLDDGPVLTDGNMRLEGLNKLSVKPIDGKYYIGVLNEDSYKNSAVPDLNNNGLKTDKFGFIAVKTDKGSQLLKDAQGLVKPAFAEQIWVYYVDQDADGNIGEEKPMYDYKYNFDTFDFHKGEAERKSLVTMSANIDPVGPTIVINTCDGSHGSHCAGIAAGYKIYGNDGNDGIAPGAYVGSLKIGSNVLSGGATTTSSMKKAYEYGIKFMEEAGFKNVIFSMSYGIGSETPGRSEIDKFLDDFAAKHPEAIIVKSMGNAGPGINSTGNPGGGYGVISVGAMIPPSTLKDLYGSKRNTDWVTHFSSRGGETSKPDVTAPGAAASTVPAYEHGDAFWGTSMSTPQVAGACAVLLSAANRDRLKVNGFMMKKAIKYTAKKLNGYNWLDYGSGLVNIPEAYKYLQILAKRGEADKLLDVVTETENTFFDDHKGTVPFYKAGSYIPDSREKINVSLKAVYPPHLSESEKANFYRVYKFRSTENWLETDKSSVYMKGTQEFNISLLIDDRKLKKPGVYVGRINAFADNENNGGYPEFDIQATVVVPEKLTDNYKLKMEDKSLPIGDIERIFVSVPPGATAMNISLSPAGSKFFNMGLYVCAPNGNKLFTGYHTDNEDRNPIKFTVDKSKLEPGVWEIIPYCHYQSREKSYFDLEVSFSALNSFPEVISGMNHEIGEKPKGSFTVTNMLDENISAIMSGSIEGYAIKKDHISKGKEVFTKKINIGSDISKLVLNISMADGEFNKVTDLAVNIYNSSGKSVMADGMSRSNEEIHFTPPGPGEYELELVPAFVSNQIMNGDWNFTITEKYYYSSPVNLNISPSNTDLLPGLKYNINFTAGGNIPEAPDGCNSFGSININEKDTGNRLLLQKICIRK